MDIEWHNEGCTENWKPKGQETTGQAGKKWTGEPNQNFRIIGIDNPKESTIDREELRRMCGAVMGLVKAYKS